ncbi:MAG TPA: hypothetical protein VHK25_09820 [Acidimicrobiales bacterium]|nr:hypothetical protein [Acidimicrobiales bacterium]
MPVQRHAGMAILPHRRPIARAQRWDGIVPLGPQGYTSPEELTTYLQGVERPPGWDVLAAWAPAVPADEYASAGATWLVDSVWPEGDWVADIRGRVAAGPLRQ